MPNLLDEPTNYLDIEGLERRENWLQGFPGALLLVSHDRHFIDKIATRLLVLKREGVVNEVAGN